MKILFVCTGVSTVRIFRNILDYLKNHNLTFLSLDNFYFQSSEEELKRNRLTYWKLDNPHSAKGRISDLPILTIWAMLLFKIKPQIKNYLSKEKPDLIVLGTDMGFIERLIIKKAKLRNIRTVLIQHGWLFRLLSPHFYEIGDFLKYHIRNVVRFFLERINFDYLGTGHFGKGGCDIVMVFGEGTRNRLIKTGVPDEKIIVVGNPVFDNGLDKKNNDTISQKHFPKPLISIFTTAILADLRDTKAHLAQMEEVQCILSLLKKHFKDDVQIMIKLHPREDLRDYSRFINMGYAVEKDLDSLIAIRMSDLVITSMSSIFLESIFLGKPLLITNIKMRKTSVDKYIIKNEGIPCAESEVEFLDYVKKFIRDKNYRENSIEKQQGFLDGELYRPKNGTSRLIADRLVYR